MGWEPGPWNKWSYYHVSVFANVFALEPERSGAQRSSRDTPTLLDGEEQFANSQINQKTTEISLASFQKGAYILEVTANGSIKKQTIFKE